MSTKWKDILSADAITTGNLLAQKAMSERQKGKKIYPPQSEIFRAFDLTPPDTVKVVIIGQDPYHGPNQANGLAFSVSNETNTPPSLQNIFKELNQSMNIPYDRLSNDLTRWAEQGVLLMNSSLTVEESLPASHSQWGWGILTGAVLKACLLMPQPIVFLLWGAHAHNLMDKITNSLTDRTVLANKGQIRTTHPSPLSAARNTTKVPAFLGSGVFASANQFLIQNHVPPIDWTTI